MDVRLVLFILISVISAIQYYRFVFCTPHISRFLQSVVFHSQYSNYNAAIDYLVTVPKYRIQAQEIARQEGLLSNADTSKKARGRKAISKQEEEAIIRQIVQQKLDIKGGYKKPSMFCFAV